MCSQINTAEKKKLLKELISRQLKNISIDRKLRYKDLCRITKYIESSIFSELECCVWCGYVTNLKNISKGTYINFYFRNKKVALHRLLYDNFVGLMEEDEYLKFSCENRGKCCNVNHMIKYKYNVAIEKEVDGEDGENNDRPKPVKPVKAVDPQLFTLSFD